MHFEERHGTIYLIDGNEIKAAYRELAFCFDKAEGILLKYGERERIEAYATDARKRYSTTGFEDIAENVMVVSAEKWDLETINKFIDISDYIGHWWKQQQDLLEQVDLAVFPRINISLKNTNR